LRVALVIERFEPAGGVESVAWTVAHRLAAAGEEVHVVARRGVASGGISLHRVSVPSFWQPLRVLAFSRAAGACALALGCDVVHSFSRTRHQDVYRAGGGSHADYLRHGHGLLGRSLRRLSPRHAVLLALERAIFSDPRQIVQCNSAMVRDEIARRHGVPPERLVVIPNGVDLERFHPRRRDSEGARLRSDQGAAGRTVWLLAGSGLRRKGLDTALRALARGGPRDAELWVMGRDAPRPWLARAQALGVAVRVRFLGERRDVESVYAAADALILPTRYDAFANVCLEAAAAGLPVVTSGSNGAAPFLGAGAIVVRDPEDVIGFAQALDELADPARRAELGRAGRRAAELLSWDAHVAALRALYRRVAA
jgi:UDP-glucose:(heptosyl)LPS alpha-1,3-glucosyltransferase